MIEVNNIVKQYGSHLAVDHLSFRVEKGQIYGFLGPNGAGKSTTMNIITGYLASNEGTVVINGHDILEEPEEAKKCIGYLPEIPPLYPDMTVMEYLDFVAGLKNVQKSEKDEILEDIIEKTYLDSVKDRLIKNLSKGYKQRVGLAQALIGNPEILILDEPTVGLDPKQIMEIRSLIKELAKEHTVILSSHILSEVSAICDQIMIDAIKRIIDEINLCKDELEQFEMFSPHCFRHSFATRCFEASIPPKTVQTYLGHASLQMTMDLYTSVLATHKQEEMKKLESVMNDVFECGDSITEERFRQNEIKQNKVIALRRMG